MVITKLEDVTKQGFCKLPPLWRKLRLLGSLFILVLIQFQTHSDTITQESGVGVGAYMSAYSRWALIQGWALHVFEQIRYLVWSLNAPPQSIAWRHVTNNGCALYEVWFTYGRSPKGARGDWSQSFTNLRKSFSRYCAKIRSRFAVFAKGS